MAKTTTSRLNQTRWSSGTDTVRRLDFDTDAASLESLTAIYGQGLLSARPTAGKSGRFYTVTGEGSASLNGRIYYDNGTIWSAPRFLSDGYSEASAVGNTALTVKGFASQTADIFKVTNSAEASPFIRVTSSGVVSNQSSLGVSSGFYLGFDSSHDASASFVSLAAAKPVLTVKGAASQSAPLISARDSSSATVFSVSATGDAILSGALQSATLTVSGASTLNSLTTLGALSTKNLFSSPVNANGVAATFAGFSSHLNNIVAFTDSTGARLARVSADGTIATNTRIVVGPGQGNLSDPSYASNTASLWVKNGYSAAPVAKFVGNDAQSGNIFELASGNSGNPLIFSVDNTGNTFIDANLQVRQYALFGSTGAPTTFFNGYQPKFEINTGNATGTYSEAVVIRHPQQSATVTSRKLGLYFKMSDETTTDESAKWAGIVADSSLASAGAPNLAFWAGNTRAGWFSGADYSLNLNADLSLADVGTLRTSGNNQHWSLNSGNSIGIGLQTSTMYFRGPSNFAWYNAGAYSVSTLDPGSGGVLLMNLTRNGGDTRLTVPRVTITGSAAVDSPTPMLQLGVITSSHMNFTPFSIANYTDSSNNTQDSMFLQGGAGGRLVFGGNGARVEVPERTIFVGSGRIFFGFSTWEAVGGAPVNDDWWFDASNNQIKVRNGSVWQTIAA